MNEDTGNEKTSTSVGAGQAPDTAGQGVATSPMYGNFVSRVSVKVPPFWSDHPEIWFAQIEAQFVVSGIVADETKYSTVIAAIESQVLVQISDAVLKPPATGKYEFLKKCIIERFCESEQKKIQKLLSDMHLGDRRPTQLLNELRSLAKDRVMTSWHHCGFNDYHRMFVPFSKPPTRSCPNWRNWRIRFWR